MAIPPFLDLPSMQGQTKATSRAKYARFMVRGYWQSATALFCYFEHATTHQIVLFTSVYRGGCKMKVRLAGSLHAASHAPAALSFCLAHEVKDLTWTRITVCDG